MRRFLLLICALACAAAYIVWPLYTAWSIKQAVKSGDSAYLAQHFEWTPVKVTLKQSMSEMVLDPIDASVKGMPERRGLWTSLKERYGRSMVESLVDRYANPTGLPTLFSYGRTVRRDMLGKPDPDEGLPLYRRVANAWSRLDRAEFVTPTRFEIDMRDKYENTRVYAGVLELKDWRWIVTELRVRQRRPEADTESATLQLTGAALGR